ncbi:WXG100 family type VII secretion target [Streptomyces sp. NPDC047971]|uniref:WXG100 family type VII secretion target n=1 Tax=Streptomyces sp. NPDC047971 TaxID=3154499 RepID=UPI0033DB255D
MGETPKTPQAASTPLDGLTNEQLLAMLTPIQKERAEALSIKLGNAAKEITKIAEYLRARASGGLNWKGAASEAFVEWTGATASATFYLAGYTELASKCLAESAQAMVEAKSGVDDLAKTSADAKADYASAQRMKNAAIHDPGAGKTEVKTATDSMNAAATARERARIEALMKLRSLGQTYTHNGQRVNSAPRPEFPAPSTMNDEWRSPRNMMQLPGSSSSGRVSSTTGGYETAGRAKSTGTGDGSVGGDTDGGVVRPVETTPTRPGTAVPEPNVELEIDGGLVLPDAPTLPSGPPGTTAPHRPDTPVTYPDGRTMVPPPLTGGTSNPYSPGGGGKVPPTMRGLPGPGTVGPTNPVARTPRDGIVGGRQVPQNGRPQVGLPRTTVIGQETTHGRGPMGTGPHMGGSGPGQGAGYQNGRRLATESGGMVGGRAQQSGQASARPFTPGGSGLVRGGQPGAGGAGAAQGRAMGAPLHGAGARTGDSRSEERNGERPDYLTEDEETWQQGARRIVPPVVD